MEVVINSCYGGFELSKEAMKLINEMKGRELSFEELHDDSIEWRSDKDLIKVVKELGDEAGSRATKLEILEFTIPKYVVKNYHDGYERIQEDDGY